MDYLLRNFTEIAFSFAGALTLLAGGLALAARLAVKPVMDTWLRIKQTVVADAWRSQQDRQLALMEAELQSLHRSVQMLIDGEEFRRKLEGASMVPSTDAETAPAPPAERQLLA
jgi:hypothetical protein